MTSRFDTIFESNFTRFQGGGFLTGDIIKFKEGWESDDWSQKAPAQVQEKIKELAGSDLVLRVSSVKSVRPAVNSSVDQAMGVDDFYLDIAQETAPGYWNGHFVTIPQHLVELNGANDGPPEVPESLKRTDDVDLKPKQMTGEDTTQQDTDMMVDPSEQTGTKDKTNKSMTDSNTTLPGATGASSYTAKYLS